MNVPDEITGSESIITLSEVEQRKWYIERWDCGQETPDCKDDDCPRHGTTAEELTALRDLHVTMSADSFETLISDEHFDQQVQDEREESGDIPDDMCSYIDWKSYAEDQRADHTSVTFRGGNYLAE